MWTKTRSTSIDLLRHVSLSEKQLVQLLQFQLRKAKKIWRGDVVVRSHTERNKIFMYNLFTKTRGITFENEINIERVQQLRNGDFVMSKKIDNTSTFYTPKHVEYFVHNMNSGKVTRKFTSGYPLPHQAKSSPVYELQSRNLVTLQNAVHLHDMNTDQTSTYKDVQATSIVQLQDGRIVTCNRVVGDTTFRVFDSNFKLIKTIQSDLTVNGPLKETRPGVVLCFSYPVLNLVNVDTDTMTQCDLDRPIASCEDLLFLTNGRMVLQTNGTNFTIVHGGLCKQSVSSIGKEAGVVESEPGCIAYYHSDWMNGDGVSVMNTSTGDVKRYPLEKNFGQVMCFVIK